jgi:hypothetical protein
MCVYADRVTPSSIAGIFTAIGTALTASSIFLGVFPAFVRMRREMRTDRIAATEDRARITAQLGVIHTLTNATLSAAYEATHAATKREEVMMREVGRMMLESGKEPSPEWRAALVSIQRRIGELSLAVQERQTQTFAANLQIASEARRQSR